jgi:hypothetical protein
MPTTNPELPQASASDEAAIHALLVEQGAIQGPEAAAEEGEAAASEDQVFDSPEEEAAAAEMAAEGGEGSDADQEAVAADDGPPEDETEEEKVARLKADSSLARRERALIEEKKKLKNAVIEATAPLRDENGKLKAIMSNVQKMVHEDPAALFKAFGREDLREIAEQIYYSLVPEEKLPPEIKARKNAMGLERRVAQLQASLTSSEQQRLQLEAAGRAKSAIKAAITKIPEKYVHLRDEAADDPESIASEVWTRIGKAISEGRAFREQPNDELLSLAYDEIEQETQSRIERAKRVHRARLGLAPAAAPVQAGAKPTTPVPPRVSKAPNGKNLRALTRPKQAPKTREEEIAQIADDIRQGKAV